MIDTARGDGFWVDNALLQQSLRGLWSVFTLKLDEGADLAPGAAGAVRRNDVEIIHIEETRAFVRGALEDGMTLVVAAPFRLAPGQRVAVGRVRDGGGENAFAETAQRDRP